MFPQSCPHRGWSLSLLLSFCWSTYTSANRKSLQNCPYRGGSRFVRQGLEGSTRLRPTLGGRQPENEILETVLFFKIKLDEVVNSASCICEMLMTCFFAISAISGKRWRHPGIKISSHWKNSSITEIFKEKNYLDLIQLAGVIWSSRDSFGIDHCILKFRKVLL